jgi:protein-disulfide isomerase
MAAFIWAGFPGPRRSCEEENVKSAVLKTIFVVIAAALAISSPMLTPSAAGQSKSSSDLTALKSLGSPSAPITIEVFADFQCPQCRNFFLTTTQQLIDNYVNAGKVYLVHHDFPLNMHSNSRQAAHWANAAALVGKFEMAEHALYEKQDTWGPTGQVEQVLAGVFSPADMKKIQTANMTQSSVIDAAIQKDMNLANMRNVQGTPTIYVSHRGESTVLPQGGVTYPLLKQYLDYLLQH